MRKRHGPKTKRHVRFDDIEKDLFLSIRPEGSEDWHDVSPDLAWEEKKERDAIRAQETRDALRSPRRGANMNPGNNRMGGSNRTSGHSGYGNTSGMGANCGMNGGFGPGPGANRFSQGANRSSGSPPGRSSSSQAYGGMGGARNSGMNGSRGSRQGAWAPKL